MCKHKPFFVGPSPWSRIAPGEFCGTREIYPSLHYLNPMVDICIYVFHSQSTQWPLSTRRSKIYSRYETFLHTRLDSAYLGHLGVCGAAKVIPGQENPPPGVSPRPAFATCAALPGKHRWVERCTARGLGAPQARGHSFRNGAHHLWGRPRGRELGGMEQAREAGGRGVAQFLGHDHLHPAQRAHSDHWVCAHGAQ